MKNKKTKDISWPKFIAYLIIFYFFLWGLYYAFEFISAPAIAYDKRINSQK